MIIFCWQKILFYCDCYHLLNVHLTRTAARERAKIGQLIIRVIEKWAFGLFINRFQQPHTH